MTTDMTAAATKQDIQDLKELLIQKPDRKDLVHIGTGLSEFHGEFVQFREETNSRFNSLEERLYAFEIHVENWKEEIVDHMHTHEQNIKLYFNAAVENFRHDLKTTKNDEFENLKDRVARLERQSRDYRIAA